MNGVVKRWTSLCYGWHWSGSFSESGFYLAGQHFFVAVAFWLRVAQDVLLVWPLVDWALQPGA